MPGVWSQARWIASETGELMSVPLVAKRSDWLPKRHDGVGQQLTTRGQLARSTADVDAGSKVIIRNWRHGDCSQRAFTERAESLVSAKLNWKFENMKTWAFNLWDNFRTGFWFVPSLAILIGLMAGIAIPQLDQLLAGSLPSWLQTTETTSRVLLTTLIGAMFTITGIVFSVSVVTLSITTSQLGPRLLRSFMGQAIAQLTLGSCIATSIYCLLLLRTIDEVADEVFVPQMSVFLAIVLATISLCIVVLFMHRVTVAIQAPNVVAAVADDLDSSIDRLYPEMIGQSPGEMEPPEEDESEYFVTDEKNIVNASEEGYLQAIDGEGILEIAVSEETMIRLYYRPGEFVVRDTPLAEFENRPEDYREIAGQVARCHIFGARPTPRQDVGCALRELVEMAVRALSPGINDPFTAMMCIDRLAASLGRLAHRHFPSHFRYDEEGNLRVIARNVSFVELLNETIGPVRQYSVASACVTLHLLRALRQLDRSTTRHDIHATIAAQIEMIAEASADHAACRRDNEAIEALTECMSLSS